MKQSKARTRCPSCGRRTMDHVTRAIQTKVGRRSISVPDVNVEECASCGERLYDLAALQMIRRARETARSRKAA